MWKSSISCSVSGVKTVSHRKLNFFGFILMSKSYFVEHFRRTDLHVFIVIRNGMIVRKVIWIKYYLQLNLSFTYIKCKHWMCWKVRMVKTTVFLMCDQCMGALIHLNFIILILIFFQLIMPGVNYVIYGCSSATTTLGVSRYHRSL